MPQCPTKVETVKNYINEGIIKEKVFYQIQLQVAMSGRKKVILVVADPKFEEKCDQNGTEHPKADPLRTIIRKSTSLMYLDMDTQEVVIFFASLPKFCIIPEMKTFLKHVRV